MHVKLGSKILTSKVEPLEKKLSVRATNLNKLLSGGFQSNTPYLIFGANKTGKTQICHYLCLESYLFQKKISKREKKQNQFCSLYFDTENTFRPEKILNLANIYELNGEEVLKSILVAKIMSTTALLLKLKDSESVLKSLNNPLLIIDSLNNYFRVDLGNAGVSYDQVRNKIQKILEKLMFVTSQYNTFTIATAQVSPQFDSNNPNPERPYGNLYLNRYFSEFIYLRLNENQYRYASLVKSYTSQEKKILFKISDSGIEDVKI